jgi:hypothetical protein
MDLAMHWARPSHHQRLVGHQPDTFFSQKNHISDLLISEITLRAAAAASFVALALGIHGKGIWCTALTPYPMPLPWGRLFRALLSTLRLFSVDVGRE